MKKIAGINAVLLTAMILLQSVSLILVDAGYNSNHSYIASALCVNRDKPQMHCDGKCFLKKELNKEQEKDSTPRAAHPNSSITFFCEEISTDGFIQNKQEIFLPRINPYLSSGFITTSERPPTC